MSDELKPCPFCKSSDVFVERADFSSCFVQCNDWMRESALRAGAGD